MCPIRQYQWNYSKCVLQAGRDSSFSPPLEDVKVLLKEILFLVKYQQPWHSLYCHKQVHLQDKPSSSSLFSLLFGCCSLTPKWKWKTSSAFINKRPVFLAFLSEFENTRCVWGGGRSILVVVWLVIGKQWKGVWKPSFPENPKQSLCFLNYKAIFLLNTGTVISH